MGLFSRRTAPSDADAGRLDLPETWQLVAQRYALELVLVEPRAVHARGEVRGRRVDARIRGQGSGLQAFMSEFRPPQRRRDPRDPWQCALSVECSNPRGLTGSLSSFVDVRDPSWDPRNFDPAHCRVIRTDPDALAATVITPSVRERLSSIHDDVTIEIAPTFVRVAAEGSAAAGEGSYLAGCLIHHYGGPVQPWPERGVAGPAWWLDLLLDMADALDAA